MNTRIGVVSVRLGGLDGVSLEVDKWVKVLRRMKCRAFFCVGAIASGAAGYSQITGENYPELDKATVVPGLSVDSRHNKWITSLVLRDNLKKSDYAPLEEEIVHAASHIEDSLQKWINQKRIDKIIVQNINSLPVHIPAAVAISGLLDKNPNLIALFHHHDFYWERDYFLKNRAIRHYLKEYFPPQKKNAFHITINSSAKRELLKRHGIDSVIIPNIFDPHVLREDDYNGTLRGDIGLKKDDLFFLAPVRIVPRKNLEAAFGLVKKLNNPKIKLVVAGCVDPLDFNSREYFKRLETVGRPIKKNLRFVCGKIGPRRRVAHGKKIYTIFDAYARADFVLYPTIYEGWGNALGEAMTFKIPFLVNRYGVFREDIEPLGVEGVKINNGKITRKAVEEVKEIILNKSLRKKITEKNYSIVKEHFSLDVLEKYLKKLDCRG